MSSPASFKTAINRKWRKAHNHFFTIEEVRSLLLNKYLKTATYFYRLRENDDVETSSLPETLRTILPGRWFSAHQLCLIWDGQAVPITGDFNDIDSDRVVYDFKTGVVETVPRHIKTLVDWKARNAPPVVNDEEDVDCDGCEGEDGCGGEITACSTCAGLFCDECYVTCVNCRDPVCDDCVTSDRANKPVCPCCADELTADDPK